MTSGLNIILSVMTPKSFLKNSKSSSTKSSILSTAEAHGLDAAIKFRKIKNFNPGSTSFQLTEPKKQMAEKGRLGFF